MEEQIKELHEKVDKLQATLDFIIATMQYSSGPAASSILPSVIGDPPARYIIGDDIIKCRIGNDPNQYRIGDFDTSTGTKTSWQIIGGQPNEIIC